MPHFENVTQIRADYPTATATGGHYGVIHRKRKKLLPGRSVPAAKKQNGKKNQPS
jgi:hypothetical protein